MGPPPPRPPPAPPLPADPFVREEAWIASDTGETVLEFEERLRQPRRPPPDAGIYLWK